MSAMTNTEIEDRAEVAESEAEDTEPGPEPTEDLLLQGVSPDLLAHLGDPTPDDEIEYREAKSKGGATVMKPGTQEPLMLAYVTARYVQDRLDFVAGPQNWQSTFEDTATGAVRCRIGILILRPGFVSGEWVWKTDVGTPTMIEADKGAHSDAFKRAGVQWGIARDLYDERADATAVTTPVVQQTNGTPQQKTMRQQLEETAEAKALASGVVTYEDAEPQFAQDGGWVCPIHGDVKIVPAGISNRTGNAYPAFRACPIGGCDQKEPFKKRS